MEVHSAVHSSHHDCPLTSSELSVGQMVKWMNKRHWEQWTQVTTQAAHLKKGLSLTSNVILKIFHAESQTSVVHLQSI